MRSNEASNKKKNPQKSTKNNAKTKQNKQTAQKPQTIFTTFFKHKKKFYLYPFLK
jgi:hypothetical protein